MITPTIIDIRRYLIMVLIDFFIIDIIFSVSLLNICMPFEEYIFKSFAHFYAIKPVFFLLVRVAWFLLLLFHFLNGLILKCRACLKLTINLAQPPKCCCYRCEHLAQLNILDIVSLPTHDWECFLSTWVAVSSAVGSFSVVPNPVCLPYFQCLGFKARWRKYLPRTLQGILPLCFLMVLL